MIMIIMMYSSININKELYYIFSKRVTLDQGEEQLIYSSCLAPEEVSTLSHDAEFVHIFLGTVFSLFHCTHNLNSAIGRDMGTINL